MGQYNTIYDILKQFEIQVVKKNHYTKAQADTTFITSNSVAQTYATKSALNSKQDSTPILTSLLDNLNGKTNGLVKVQVSEGSEGNIISIDNKAYVTADDLYNYDEASGTLILKKI